MNIQPQAIFFDLDDTVISFSSGSKACWRRVCQEFVREPLQHSPEEVLEAIVNMASWYWSNPERHQVGRLNLNEARKNIVFNALANLNITSPTLADQIANSYISERENSLRLYPRAIETLRHLRERNIRLALITNGASTDQWAKINRFDLTLYFDRIFVEGDLGFGKPDPRVYHHAIHQLEVQPEETWMVGDNLDWEVWGPQQIGIKGIWVDYRQSGLPKDTSVQPDHIVHSIAEIPGLIA